MNGLIFDIQRSSMVDGDGVRTAVFFKGCNLRCKWCHNPEGIGAKAQILFYKSRCVSCGRCADVCPQGDGCILCGKCADVCPQNAKELCGRSYDTGSLLEIIERDRELYEATGGGVTFSGGECMLQLDFLEELLRECKKRGINTSVDTAGNVTFECFERVLPYVDTFLYDIKCINEELHREYTGSSNRLILENLDRLVEGGARVVVRVPVIGGFNDGDVEINEIFQFLKNKSIEKVEILRYHNMGAHKCEGAGVPFCEFIAPTEEKIKEIEEIFKEI